MIVFKITQKLPEIHVFKTLPHDNVLAHEFSKKKKIKNKKLQKSFKTPW